MLQNQTHRSPEPASAALANSEHREIAWLRLALPLVVLIALVGAVTLLWVSETERGKAEASIEGRNQARQLARHAGELLEAELARTRDLAQALGKIKRVDANQFLAVIGKCLKGPHSIRVVGWSGRTARPDPPTNLDFSWASSKINEELVKPPSDKPNEKQPNDRKLVEPWNYTTARVFKDKTSHVAALQVRDHQVELWAVTPATTGEGSVKAYLGSVLFRIDLTHALATVEGAEPPLGRDIRIESRGMTIYARGSAILPGDEQVDRVPVPALDAELQLSVRADREAIVTGRASPTWILILGLPVAVGVAGAVWYLLALRARTAAEARWQIAALEELTRAAGTVSTDMDEGHGALDQLAGSARRLLGMKMASIALVDLPAGRIELVARDGLDRDHPTIFTTAEGKGTLSCFHSGETLVVEDTRTDPRVNPKVLADMYGIVSVILIPLVVGQKPVGVMYLGNDKPRRYTPTQVRLAGVLGAQAGVFLAILKLLREKEEAYETQQQLASQRESLYQIAGEIYLNEDLPQSLQRLADAAPAVIGVDICTVSLRTGRGNEVQIYAVTHDIGDLKGERHDVTGTHAEEAWATRLPVLIVDGPSDARLHPALRHRLHVGSMALLPLLRTDRKPIGVLALIRSQPSTFTRQQLDLATIIAARAATAIEKARLYSSARRLASSQETLLRELNHRVKNNLSSIVTLLEVNRPNLSKHAERWLDRVTGRVATMARTHDLFVGGTASVSLGDLVSKLLPSLSVVKPQGSHIVTQIQAHDIRLPTDRAVSLAMVLNELCWNALEHGVGREGILYIRANRLGEARLLIEIQDDGGKSSEARLAEPIDSNRESEGEPLSTHGPRGMGLKLVEGLVSRELGGKFEISHLETGGTLAQVELPILDEAANTDESPVAESGSGRLS